MATRERPLVGGFQFDSKTQLTIFARSIVESYDDGELMSDDDRDWFITLIRERHDSPGEKLLDGKDVVGIRVCHESAADRLHWGKNSGGNHTVVVYSDREIDFSWLKCCRGFSAEEAATGAMRKAVAFQIMRYKHGVFGAVRSVTCPVSGEPLSFDTCQVDHWPRLFCDIRDDFLDAEGVRLGDVAVQGDPKGGSLMAFKEQEDRWAKYHNANASYRLVSPAVNRSTWSSMRTGGAK
jgi:hypothetical protein